MGKIPDHQNNLTAKEKVTECISHSKIPNLNMWTDRLTFSPWPHFLSKSERRLPNNAPGLGRGLWPSRPCCDRRAATTELKSAEYQSAWMSVFSSALMLQLRWCWGINTVSSHVMGECVVQQKSALAHAAGAKGVQAAVQSGETDSREGSCLPSVCNRAVPAS